MLQEVRAGDEGPSREMVRRHHPDPGAALTPGAFAVGDAELTVARAYGFSDWSALVHYLEVAGNLSFDPGDVGYEDGLDEADRFCALATIRYSDADAPPRYQAAAALLARCPDLVDRSVWAAAAAADAAALGRHLAARAGSALEPGGPYGWTPLMYLAYSRAPAGRTEAEVVAAATVLLDAGADPNAGCLWCRLPTPFTVLTGVFGEGEQGPRRQPRHPHWQALAALLLDRGAHPADQQTLYNRMFRLDDSHLQLLFAHGLADAGPSPWEQRLGEAMETRERMWRRQVDWAAAHGFSARLDLLSRHGVDVGGVAIAEPPTMPADPNKRDGDGATPLHRAAWHGDLDLIRRLLAAGADPTATETRFGATPLGWAEHAYQTEAADLLRSVPGRL